MSPTLGSKSAVRTLRSTNPLLSTSGTPRVTIPPQSQLPRTLTVFSSKLQPAVAIIVLNRHEGNRCDDSRSVANPGLAPTGVQASGNRGVVMSQFQVYKDFVGRERDRYLDSVEIQSERDSLYVYLEQIAESAVLGEYSARRRLSEVEADTEVS